MTIRTKTLIGMAARTTGILAGIGFLCFAAGEAGWWYFCVRESNRA